MALVVVLAIVGGLVAIVRSIAGSDTPTNAQPESSVSASSDTGVADSTVGAGSVAVAPTTPPTAVRTPTTADPARVLLVGDSDAGGLSPFLERVLKPGKLTALTTDYKVSSGLVRPDFFDWPARLAATVPTADPDIVVALFGANDGQPFLDMASQPVDSAEWRAEYGKRVGNVMDILTAGGRTLIWVGVPNGRDESLTAALAVQNEVVKDQIAKHPGVLFVDQWYYFSALDDSFSPLALDPRDGTYVPVRKDSDGFHLNTVGEEILAIYVAGEINAELRRRGATDAGAGDKLPFDVSTGGTYDVVAGDALSKIADLFHTTSAAIVTANGWTDENHLIYPGLTIKLPGKPPS